eukprot:TRINITY_DN1850_c4_g2_i1.p1 TRINITY_DN1850_c4_g2~~TRINITY_DN1850_c4_g2_i1.p1  ORF type:complete len:369 (+),score=45.53 TRINITY_DN1850_c4_g2_i1:267-1373(+)
MPNDPDVEALVKIVKTQEETQQRILETLEKMGERLRVVEERSAVNHEESGLIQFMMRGGVLVVDASGAGGFRSITSALGVAKTGDLILVRPGVYSETISLTVPGVTIRGVSKEDVVIEHCDDTSGLLFKSECTVECLSVNSKIPHNCAVRFEASGVLSNCYVTSVNVSCVIVSAGSPSIQNCEITGSKQHGVSCKPATTPVITHCKIHLNKQPNIVVEKSSSPTIRQCEIYDSEQNGVWFRDGSQGVLSGCAVYNNKYSNIDVSSGASPVISGNDIHGSSKCGVCFADDSSGELTGNTIHGNHYSNVGVMAGATPTITGNNIHTSKQHGVLVKSYAAGTVSENTVHSNSLEAIKVEQGAATVVENNSR